MGRPLSGRCRCPKRRPVRIELELPDPALWWTHDLGEPALYDLTVELHAGEQVLDTYHERAGVRTIAVDQSPDSDEPDTRFFAFVLNGVKLFAKGAPSSRTHYVHQEFPIGCLNRLPGNQSQAIRSCPRDCQRIQSRSLLCLEQPV